MKTFIVIILASCMLSGCGFRWTSPMTNMQYDIKVTVTPVGFKEEPHDTE